MIERFDPREALFDVQRALEARLQSNWLGDMTAGAGSFPPINVFQKGQDFVALIEMPGVSKNDLALQAKETTIRISGKKAVEYGDKVSGHRRERVAGTFDRTITLPFQIDAQGIKAECRDGILAVFIPRAESDKPRVIKVD